MSESGLRARIFRLGGRALRSAPLRPIARRYFAARASVIFYHAVWPPGDERARLFGGVELGRFAAELRRLARVFRFVTLTELLAAQRDGAPAAPNGRPMLAVTFDDGFDLVGTGAADAMGEAGVKATVFVNSASVGYERLMWQHRFASIRAMRGDAALVEALAGVQARLGSTVPMRTPADQIAVTRSWPVDDKEALTDEAWDAARMPAMGRMLDEHRPYMDRETLRDWLARGHEVGFHTRSHPFCSLLDRRQMQRELIDPVDELRAELGLASMTFAYPFGDRLPADLEGEVAASGAFDCLLGTGGFSGLGTPPAAMDRVEAEAGVDAEVFGKPILRSLRRGERGAGSPPVSG